MRALLSPLLFLGTGCEPFGTISTREGWDRLRSAWHYDSHVDEQSVRLVLLSNSPLECSTPDAEALSQYQTALSREGARLVGFALYTSAPGWEGSYPIESPVDPSALDSLEPRAAEAIYLGVNEAVATASHGLYRAYEAEDADVLYAVPPPGEVEIERVDDEHQEGTFFLDSIDVSGSFRSTSCGAVEDIFLLIGLLDV